MLRRAAIAADLRQTVLSLAEVAGLAVTAHESPEGTLRLVLTGGPAPLERTVAALTEGLRDRVRLWGPSANVLVVQSGAATKLNALAALTRELGIDASAVAYTGDAHDDAEALHSAGLGSRRRNLTLKLRRRRPSACRPSGSRPCCRGWRWRAASGRRAEGASGRRRAA